MKWAMSFFASIAMIAVTGCAQMPAQNAAAQSDKPPVGKSSSKKSKKARRVVDCRCSAPEPRLVVSGESRAYLKDVESRLDAALAR